MARRARRLARRGKLLGLAPLGQGQGGGVAGPDRFIGPPYYLLNDTFTTNRAAGAVNGTDAEPGPGRRLVVDTNGKLSLSGGNLLLATGGLAAGDPGLWYSGISRAPGRVMVASASYTTGVIEVGFDANQAGSLFDGARMTGTTLAVRAQGTQITVGAAAASTTYQFAVIQRAAGFFWFVKGGAFTNWTLVWLSSAGNSSFPGFTTTSTASVGTLSYLRVPATPWLPAPLLSDGFSTFATSAPTATDGLGHAEGIAGGLGAGGGGVWPYTQVGTWQASGGWANASALSSGSAIAYANAGKADIIASVKLTRSGGDGGLLLRFVDGNNFISCRHDGTNVLLIKKVAGVNTTVQSTAAIYVAGAELRVIATGSAFRVYYNNALVGSEQTISDAALQSPTNHGLYTTNTGNTFDDLVIYARGAGGEYAALDAF
ncbi:MAG: hypothetical protein E6Q97_14320 [Desulfurellales bacterium]|nr:MAG: hypothetical protein E6Q97_14320 [Desulfurellales bacterium]